MGSPRPAPIPTPASYARAAPPEQRYSFGPREGYGFNVLTPAYQASPVRSVSRNRDDGFSVLGPVGAFVVGAMLFGGN